MQSENIFAPLETDFAITIMSGGGDSLFSPCSFEFLDTFSYDVNTMDAILEDESETSMSPIASPMMLSEAMMLNTKMPAPFVGGSHTVPCTPSLSFSEMTLDGFDASSVLFEYSPSYMMLPQQTPMKKQRRNSVKSRPRHNSLSTPRKEPRQTALLTPPFSPLNAVGEMDSIYLDNSTQINTYTSPYQLSAIAPRPEGYRPRSMSEAPLSSFGERKKYTKQPKGEGRMLNEEEIHQLFMAAKRHPNPIRCKRDVAILCLIMDTHLSSGTIIQLAFGSVRSLLELALSSEEPQSFEGHAINVLSTNSISPDPTRHQLHPFTAWALYTWINELVHVFQWDTTLANPLFINSQPSLDHSSGSRILRKIPLKRDAISKVFQAIKARSGVRCPKTMTAVSNLDPIHGSFLELQTKLLALDGLHEFALCNKTNTDIENDD